MSARADGQALWAALENGEHPRDAGRRLGIPPKQVQYLCLKWSRRGVYDYGTVCDIGWIKGSDTIMAEHSRR